jgi:hypothetical protein
MRLVFFLKSFASGGGGAVGAVGTGWGVEFSSGRVAVVVPWVRRELNGSGAHLKAYDMQHVLSVCLSNDHAGGRRAQRGSGGTGRQGGRAEEQHEGLPGHCAQP